MFNVTVRSVLWFVNSSFGHDLMIFINYNRLRPKPICDRRSHYSANPLELVSGSSGEVKFRDFPLEFGLEDDISVVFFSHREV